MIKNTSKVIKRSVALVLSVMLITVPAAADTIEGDGADNKAAGRVSRAADAANGLQGTTDDGINDNQLERFEFLETFSDMEKANRENSEELPEEFWMRIAGSDRYETSAKAADFLSTCNGMEKFQSIVLASGKDFPDALTGCLLSEVNSCPMFLIDPDHNEKSEKLVREYVSWKGKVYILGGTSVVPEELELSLQEAGYDVERLSGNTRYDTNLAILNAIGDPYALDTLLICSGKTFADSLSASATGHPMLLVGDELTQDQKEWLSKTHLTTLYLVGGDAAVSSEVEEELTDLLDCREVIRLAGADRVETSVKVAEEFFGETLEQAVITYAQNFPDGLSGGPVAFSLKAPVLLADDDNKSCVKYLRSHGCNNLIIMGGEANISDKTVEFLTWSDADAYGSFMEAVAGTADLAQKQGWLYGNSQTIPPCEDGLVACDRLISRALWAYDPDYRDQPVGGMTVFNMEAYLTAKGWERITQVDALQVGDVVLMKTIGSSTPNALWHSFVIAGFRSPDDIDKYDAGNQSRIDAGCLVQGVPIDQWDMREFYCAFRMPANGN